jgi:hypothetical protein
MPISGIRSLSKAETDRPTRWCSQHKNKRVVVVVAPITHMPPKNPAWAVEIPAATKERLGLDTEQSWVNVTEVNRFVWPGPDLRPISRNQSDRYDYGVLPPKLFKEIKARLLAQAEAQKMMTVTRTELTLARQDCTSYSLPCVGRPGSLPTITASVRLSIGATATSVNFGHLALLGRMSAIKLTKLRWTMTAPGRQLPLKN